MRRVFDQARLVAKWNTTVLIRGETGTGKELIANAIHYNSPRARNAMVRLNCAALPENLLESELFGHERGAFTGAVESRKGRFEQAHGGTLFLDEIGEVSPPFQAKLLRILQEGEFERVGGSKTIKVDVRIIAATHRDLETAVDMGDFREDLFYRLNVMPIFLPPLRERIEDIPEIARHLLTKIGNDQKRKLSLTDMAQRRLANHDWPGNVRELENCLERAAVLSEDGKIDVDLIRFPSSRERTPPGRSAAGGACCPQDGLLRREASPLARRGAVNPAFRGKFRGGRYRRPQSFGKGTRHRRAGAGRLGSGQGRPHPRHDPAPDRLPHPDAEHRGQAVLSLPACAGRPRIMRFIRITFLASCLEGGRQSARSGHPGIRAIALFCYRFRPRCCHET